MKMLILSDELSETTRALKDRDHAKVLPASISPCPVHQELNARPINTDVPEDVKAFLAEVRDADIVVFELSDDQELDHFLRWIMRFSGCFDKVVSASVLRSPAMNPVAISENRLLSEYLDTRTLEKV